MRVSPDVFRAARPGDAEAILDFWLRATEAPSSTDDLEGIQTLLRRDPDAMLLAEDDGRIVGTVVAAWDGWRGRIYRLAVEPAARGRGLGRALVAAAERRLRDLGPLLPGDEPSCSKPVHPRMRLSNQYTSGGTSLSAR